MNAKRKEKMEKRARKELEKKEKKSKSEEGEKKQVVIDWESLEYDEIVIDQEDSILPRYVLFVKTT